MTNYYLTYYLTLKKKLQKYEHYHLEKLIDMNILQVKKILPSKQRQIIEEAKFAYSLLGKAFEKQPKQLNIKKKTNKSN